MIDETKYFRIKKRSITKKTHVLYNEIKNAFYCSKKEINNKIKQLTKFVDLINKELNKEGFTYEFNLGKEILLGTHNSEEAIKIFVENAHEGKVNYRNFKKAIKNKNLEEALKLRGELSVGKLPYFLCDCIDEILGKLILELLDNKHLIVKYIYKRKDNGCWYLDRKAIEFFCLDLENLIQRIRFSGEAKKPKVEFYINKIDNVLQTLFEMYKNNQNRAFYEIYNRFINMLSDFAIFRKILYIIKNITKKSSSQGDNVIVYRFFLPCIDKKGNLFVCFFLPPPLYTKLDDITSFEQEILSWVFICDQKIIELAEKPGNLSLDKLSKSTRLPIWKVLLAINKSKNLFTRLFFKSLRNEIDKDLFIELINIAKSNENLAKKILEFIDNEYRPSEPECAEIIKQNPGLFPIFIEEYPNLILKSVGKIIDYKLSYADILLSIGGKFTNKALQHLLILIKRGDITINDAILFILRRTRLFDTFIFRNIKTFIELKDRLKKIGVNAEM
ncbi:MAG: hypothetical protein ACP6IQ_10490 [Candidatus Njordarchaeia archaeon]